MKKQLGTNCVEGDDIESVIAARQRVEQSGPGVIVVEYLQLIARLTALPPGEK
jgi:hypothetical protein